MSRYFSQMHSALFHRAPVDIHYLNYYLITVLCSLTWISTIYKRSVSLALQTVESAQVSTQVSRIKWGGGHPNAPSAKWDKISYCLISKDLC